MTRGLAGQDKPNEGQDGEKRLSISSF